MRNKKLIPFETIEKAVAGRAGSHRRGITALHSDGLNICLPIAGILMTIFKTV